MLQNSKNSFCYQFSILSAKLNDVNCTCRISNFWSRLLFKNTNQCNLVVVSCGTWTIIYLVEYSTCFIKQHSFLRFLRQIHLWLICCWTWTLSIYKIMFILVCVRNYSIRFPLLLRKCLLANMVASLSCQRRLTLMFQLFKNIGVWSRLICDIFLRLRKPSFCSVNVSLKH